MRICLVISFVLGTALGVPAPHIAHADDSSNGVAVDISAAVNGAQIMAGVRIGIPPSINNDVSNCEWSPAIPRDSMIGSNGEVFKQIGSIRYQLYDYTCSDRTPATSYYWIPQVSNETLASEASSVLYDNIPAPWGEFAPPAHRGVVKLGMWFWVNPLIWVPVSVTAWVPTPSGPISVTTTATPKKLKFQPGDGDLGSGEVECNGPGRWWFPIFGDSLDSTCMYTYQHSSALHSGGAFPAKLGIEWHVTWRSNTGASGTLRDVTLNASHQIVVHELQALVTK
jgi:hypothetical protein